MQGDPQDKINSKNSPHLYLAKMLNLSHLCRVFSLQNLNSNNEVVGWSDYLQNKKIVKC